MEGPAFGFGSCENILLASGRFRMLPGGQETGAGKPLGTAEYAEREKPKSKGVSTANGR
jgi:hypothetical protein